MFDYSREIPVHTTISQSAIAKSNFAELKPVKRRKLRLGYCFKPIVICKIKKNINCCNTGIDAMEM